LKKISSLNLKKYPVSLKLGKNLVVHQTQYVKLENWKIPVQIGRLECKKNYYSSESMKISGSIIFEDVTSEIKFIKILSCVGHHILQQQQVDGA
jgi:hypothetical protein